jgi:predicted RNase H-like HicB family nuclease
VGFTVEVPELAGSITEGDPLAEAKQMAREAVALWLEISADRRRRAHTR